MIALHNYNKYLPIATKNAMISRLDIEIVRYRYAIILVLKYRGKVMINGIIPKRIPIVHVTINLYLSIIIYLQLKSQKNELKGIE